MICRAGISGRAALLPATPAAFLKCGKRHRSTGTISGKLLPQSDAYATGQTFLHRKLGCFATVLSPLEVAVTQAAPQPSSFAWQQDEKKGDGRRPAQPQGSCTYHFRPSQCAGGDDMVRVISEKGAYKSAPGVHCAGGRCQTYQKRTAYM